ncbi:MAG: hypothetical protein COA47_01670 [Robiginitomaculum sp.]|nr:MAG: hypothetical protein COA47_01670 [Robiginitomaculum sp.]
MKHSIHRALILVLLAPLPLLAGCLERFPDQRQAVRHVAAPIRHAAPVQAVVHPVVMVQRDQQLKFAVDTVVARLRQAEADDNWAGLEAASPQIYQLASALLPGGAVGHAPIAPAHAGQAKQHVQFPAKIHNVSTKAAGVDHSNFADAPQFGNARSLFFALQVGSYRSAERAFAGWDELQRQASELHGLTPRIEQVNLGERGIFYRLKAGPLHSSGEVDAKCQALKARNIGCTRADFTGMDRS